MNAFIGWLKSLFAPIPVETKPEQKTAWQKPEATEEAVFETVAPAAPAVDDPVASVVDVVPTHTLEDDAQAEIEATLAEVLPTQEIDEAEEVLQAELAHLADDTPDQIGEILAAVEAGAEEVNVDLDIDAEPESEEDVATAADLAEELPEAVADLAPQTEEEALAIVADVISDEVPAAEIIAAEKAQAEVEETIADMQDLAALAVASAPAAAAKAPAKKRVAYTVENAVEDLTAAGLKVSVKPTGVSLLLSGDVANEKVQGKLQDAGFTISTTKAGKISAKLPADAKAPAKTRIAALIKALPKA